ncbi:HD-GYP domain-containing protein [Arcobacter porcinus]|uniref:Cyclic di-GMP phosphodiesterase response regulator RpfG n=1 Tax=Arcobacter porcinus TaxID=1935204 RepID=A0ABX2YJ91_9BACT|nr:HD domain-containing phosphohydrolase [Arcobacter porcinus]OCL82198.1 Cyclic di-GMP phosphodiesterase response regulator RpfG [Arcobacter porcinus]OCL84879.1 Cyclic di-GMP phosphodiesterase response regulator RpfG [Arcobacter porcinus]OCL93252.1 Cyclic di-GMP phosphodiesterase response regulator RpfG [Arcobacter porcinus]
MSKILEIKKEFKKSLEENDKKDLENIFQNLIDEYNKIEKDNQELKYIQKELILRVGSVGENRTKESGNHIKRVAEYSKLLAILYGLKKEEVELLELVSPMHDIGKAGVADSILNKPGKLNDEEFEVMKTHTTIAYKILDGVDKKIFNAAKIIAYQHHERWEGGGYPRGISGSEIDIFARITTVADVFDALGSERCYKSKWEDEKIFEFMKEESGKLFEPKLIELLIDNKNRFLEIRKRLED